MIVINPRVATPPSILLLSSATRRQLYHRNSTRLVPRAGQKRKSPMPIEPAAGKMAHAASAPLMLTSGASGRISALLSLNALRSFIMLATALLMLLAAPFRARRRPPSISSSAPNKDDACAARKVVVRVPAKRFPWRNPAAAAVSVDHEVAVRRAMAVRRVVQDQDEAGTTAREFSFFSADRGDLLFTQSWTPISIPIRGVVVVLHGLNEHSGRYGDFAKKLNANGYKVFAMDWIGHGGSDGLHAYVHSLDDAVMDLKKFIEKVTDENPGVPCFCFGHSTGGAIILKTMLDPEVEARVSGIVLTSPAVGVQPTHPIYSVLAPVMSFLLPKYQLSAAAQSAVQVSRDPEALKQNLKRLKVPFLVLHGSDDGVTDPEASRKLYNEASSLDKTLKLCEGLLHDLLFEPEKESIMADIINWMNCRSEH
uniref:Serine aminopeptidase S33 domain-containing protein n=1 Tax=Kalanchoe fedtschenkoi TaxID=63787 RepID=A0A7N0V7K2_KALFE